MVVEALGFLLLRVQLLHHAAHATVHHCHFCMHLVEVLFEQSLALSGILGGTNTLHGGGHLIHAGRLASQRGRADDHERLQQ